MTCAESGIGDVEFLYSFDGKVAESSERRVTHPGPPLFWSTNAMPDASITVTL